MVYAKRAAAWCFLCLTAWSVCLICEPSNRPWLPGLLVRAAAPAADSSGTVDPIELPEPMMADGLNADAQRAALVRAAGKYPLDRFLRASVVAPFVIEVSDADPSSSTRRMRRVDFCFVAYGPLDALGDRDLFRDLVSAQSAPSTGPVAATARTLEPDELRARGIDPVDESRPSPRYVAFDLPILDRVQLAGVCQVTQERATDSVTAVARLDPRFANDAELPNAWRPIRRDAQGRAVVGDPLPYQHLAGYVKVTRLAEPAGALLVECHVLFDEPEAWFGGKNLLRSKLPLVVQENVRAFRRRLTAERDGDREPRETSDAAATDVN